MPLAGPIAIVGAGIAGLVAALAFAARGFDVEIFERAETLEPVGAGLQLSPNALRVLDALGVGEAVREGGTSADGVLLRSGRSGRLIARVPVRGSDGTGYLSIHRGDLQSALLDAVTAQPRIGLDLGAELIALETSGAECLLSFRKNGSVDEGRYGLVVAADGVHSRVAELLRFSPPSGSGRVALRWLAENDGSEGIRTIEAWLGASRHAVAYPVRGGAATNIVAIVPERDRDRSDPFENWDPRLRELIARARAVGQWPLLTTPPQRPAVAGRIVLIGDAAHAMLPYAAQGAAMAIEDAAVLAHYLADEPDVTAALAHYESLRKPRLARVRARVAFHQRVYHLPTPLALARDLALGLRSEAALARDLAWLYDWQPPAP